jgi:hypothetical protein
VTAPWQRVQREQADAVVNSLGAAGFQVSVHWIHKHLEQLKALALSHPEDLPAVCWASGWPPPDPLLSVTAACQEHLENWLSNVSEAKLAEQEQERMCRHREAAWPSNPKSP